MTILSQLVLKKVWFSQADLFFKISLTWLHFSQGQVRLETKNLRGLVSGQDSSIFPLTKIASLLARIYNGKKTTSLTSGAGNTGQPLVRE